MATHPRDLYALCDSNRLQQVLVNLFGNALDAMEMAGSSPRQLVVDAARQGERVIVSVTDSGPGLPDDVRAHLFEPFFTTKPQGKGLGLGLAISEQIVRESGGRLRAESPPEGGARFIIDLPRAE
jgi:two-component system C4-dicarboxylate transport sensor histidine kinase DctB